MCDNIEWISTTDNQQGAQEDEEVFSSEICSICLQYRPIFLCADSECASTTSHKLYCLSCSEFGDQTLHKHAPISILKEKERQQERWSALKLDMVTTFANVRFKHDEFRSLLEILENDSDPVISNRIEAFYQLRYQFQERYHAFKLTFKQGEILEILGMQQELINFERQLHYSKKLEDLCIDDLYEEYRWSISGVAEETLDDTDVLNQYLSLKVRHVEDLYKQEREQSQDQIEDLESKVDSLRSEKENLQRQVVELKERLWSFQFNAISEIVNEDYTEEFECFVTNCFDSNWKAMDRKGRGFLKREEALAEIVNGHRSVDFRSLWERHQLRGVIGKNEMISLLKEALGIDTNLI